MEKFSDMLKCHVHSKLRQKVPPKTDKKKQPDHKAAAQMQQTICLHL